MGKRLLAAPSLVVIVMVIVDALNGSRLIFFLHSLVFNCCNPLAAPNKLAPLQTTTEGNKANNSSSIFAFQRSILVGQTLQRRPVCELVAGCLMATRLASNKVAIWPVEAGRELAKTF